MADTDVNAIKKDLDQFKGAVHEELAGVRTDLREVAKALRDLIRIEGEVKRGNDAVIRLEDSFKDYQNWTREQLEKLAVRVNKLETGAAVNTVRVGMSEWGMRFLFGGGMSIFTGLVVWALR